MVSCAVANCKNRSGKISKNKDSITFHRFPKDKARRQQWEVAVNREESWSATAYSTVCSEHFEPGQFYVTENGLRRLAYTAIPSINISPCQEPIKTIAELEPIDIKTSDTEEVQALKQKVQRLELLAENRRKRLHLMWKAKKRMKKKLENMKGIIKHLIQIKKNTDT